MNIRKSTMLAITTALMLCVPANAEVVEAPADVAADVPADVTVDVPADAPADVTADVPADAPADVAADVPVEAPADVIADVPTDAGAEEEILMVEEPTGWTEAAGEEAVSDYNIFVENVVDVTDSEIKYLFFEDDDAIITAFVLAGIDENVEMSARKLSSENTEFHEAKATVMVDYDTPIDADYTFYDVTFLKDGTEVEFDDALVQIWFKNIEVEEYEKTDVFCIDDGMAERITDSSEGTGALKSVSFSL